MFFKKLWFAIKILFSRKEDLMMLIRLYAAEILMGRMTIENVPSRLRPLVQQYLDALEALMPAQ